MMAIQMCMNWADGQPCVLLFLIFMWMVIRIKVCNIPVELLAIFFVGSSVVFILRVFYLFL